MDTGDPSDLIGRIYDTVGNEGLWPDVLKALAGELDAIGGVLVSTDLKSRRGRVLASANMDPEYLASYGAYYAAIDPWTKPYSAMQPGCIASTDERMPQKELEQTEFYADWLRPQGISRSIGGVVFKEGGKVIRLGLPRGEGQGEFEKSVHDRVCFLAPHIQRALQLQIRFSNTNRVLDASSDLLERLPFGVFLVDEGGRVVFLSRTAGDMIGAGDGLTLNGEGLHALKSTDDDALQRLLRDALDAACGVGQGAGGSLVLSRSSGRRSYQVMVTPLPQRRGIFNWEQPVAAVLVSDPEAWPDSPRNVLTGVYGLTPREAALAELLVIGDSMKSAAEQLGITRDAAGKDLQRIYRKTGVTRQAELVALMLSSPEWMLRNN